MGKPSGSGRIQTGDIHVQTRRPYPLGHRLNEKEFRGNRPNIASGHPIISSQNCLSVVYITFIWNEYFGSNSKGSPGDWLPNFSTNSKSNKTFIVRKLHKVCCRGNVPSGRLMLTTEAVCSDTKAYVHFVPLLQWKCAHLLYGCPVVILSEL